tara:strand:+ start:4081 stop:4983 length:903 start_codon:yes stop_codon:yes gene_type:complete
MSKSTINICIPVFNEEKNIKNLYEDLKIKVSVLEKKFDLNFEIIFFDDGSSDNSRQILEKLEDIELLFVDENKGLGNAIRELCLHSKEKGVNGMFKVDGDGQMDLDDLDRFLENDFYTNKDVIYGNRFHKSSNYKMPLHRRLGSKIFKIFLKLFSINISDPTNGFIYLSKKYLANLKIIGNYNAAQQILLDAKLRDLKIDEVDINLKQRSEGKSFIGIKYPIIVFGNLIGLYIYKRTLQTLIIPGLIIFLTGFLLFVYNIALWILSIKDTIISDDILFLFIILGAQLAITGFIINIFKEK